MSDCQEAFAAEVLASMFYNQKIEEKEIFKIIDDAMKVLLQQETLIEISAPVSVCGDIHGQFYDLLRIFDTAGWPPKTRYLFLGDYVDRGSHSIEVILMMFVYKVLYRDDYFILRGNHECISINRMYGFYEECAARYSIRLYMHFQRVFDCLPVAALIDNRIFCMHGGLSPHLVDFDQIRMCKRPMEIPDDGLLNDLLWADPKRGIKGWRSSARNQGCEFGADVVESFCHRMDIDLIARAHQVVRRGYEFFANHRLVTIFSAPNYCGEFGNSAGIMQVNSSLHCVFSRLALRNPYRSSFGFGQRFAEFEGVPSFCRSFESATRFAGLVGRPFRETNLRQLFSLRADDVDH
uniref:Serine/threonine-protein phosphatase n=1 Tax=Trichuris muris TaxID=70415 RepID=A0A5S6R554_TRIMR